MPRRFWILVNKSSLCDDVKISTYIIFGWAFSMISTLYICQDVWESISWKKRQFWYKVFSTEPKLQTTVSAISFFPRKAIFKSIFWRKYRGYYIQIKRFWFEKYFTKKRSFWLSIEVHLHIQKYLRSKNDHKKYGVCRKLSIFSKIFTISKNWRTVLVFTWYRKEWAINEAIWLEHFREISIFTKTDDFTQTTAIP